MNGGELGQATTEYVLMLMVAVSVFLLLRNTIFKEAFPRLQSALSSQVEKLLFPSGEGSMHRLRIR